MSGFLYDTHAHLDYFKNDEIDAVVQRAVQNSVKYINTICVDISKFDSILSISQRYKNVFCSVGQHPCYYLENYRFYDNLVALSRQYKKIVAIGETGLDFFKNYDDEIIKWQCNTFASHIDASIEVGLPLVIHTRNAGKKTLDLLQAANGLATGVIHCFTESEEFMRNAVELGLYISISGIVTFKNADQLRSIVKLIPLDRIIIETDAPYLAPEPYRGKKNEPTFVTHTAKFVASLLNMSYEEVATLTTKNAINLFKI